jgi:hypothetical protein
MEETLMDGNEEILVLPPAIEDPWFSRPIDVHRRSDHPEIKGLVQEVWTAYFGDFERAASAPGPKPKTSYHQQLLVILLDLYVAWLEDPRLSIGVALSVNYWDTTSRYNALKISKQIIPLVHRLQAVGLIDLARGSYGGPYATTNRTTRIRASSQLQEKFMVLTVKRDDIERIDAEECIVLKDGLAFGDGTKLYDYQDTPDTNRMRSELQAYNRVLAGSFIDIPCLERAVIERADQYGKVFKQPLDRHHHFMRRIFSRGSWELNGRFYGGWWQLIPSSLRKDIYINDTPTVEVDFKGLHVSILSAEQGVDLVDDPYTLQGVVLPGVNPVLLRAIVKQLVLTALNAKDRRSAFQSFRDGWPANHYGKGMTNEELSDLLDAFVAKHPHLRDMLCADQGIRLMNVDAQIAELVHKHFTDQGVPVLSVHDSFIIDYTRVRELRQVMATASSMVLGKEMPVSAKAAGLDEMQEELRLDFIHWTQCPRGAGYIQRMRDWEEKVGVEVVPYG